VANSFSALVAGLLPKSENYNSFLVRDFPLARRRGTRKNLPGPEILAMQNWRGHQSKNRYWDQT
jgi:hypothetical protein